MNESTTGADASSYMYMYMHVQWSKSGTMIVAKMDNKSSKVLWLLQ